VVTSVGVCKSSSDANEKFIFASCSELFDSFSVMC
jgi:hypothetical protein